MSILVIGQNRYGHADDLAAAKATFRRQGGRLSDGYTIVEFGDGIEYAGVDQLGRVHWRGHGEPIQRDVHPRKRSS